MSITAQTILSQQSRSEALNALRSVGRSNGTQSIFVRLFAILLCLPTVFAWSVRATETSQLTRYFLTKKGFDYLINWQCDKAILCFTPVLISQARNISNSENRKATAQLLALIGRAFQVDQNDFAGEQCYYLACQLDPGNKVYSAIRADILGHYGRIDEAEQIIKSLQAKPNDKLIVTTVIATKLNREMDSASAIKMLNPALATTSDTANLSIGYLCMARALARIGFTGNAEKYFTLAAAKTNSPYLSEICKGLAAQCHFDACAARRHFEAAGKILPDDPAWLNCLSSNPLLSDAEKLRARERAANCRRLSTDALVGLSRQLASQKRTKEALASADYIERLRPYSYEAHYARAKIYYNSCDKSTNSELNAEKEYRAALAAQPANANLYMEFAQFCADTKQLDKAKEIYRAGLKRCPNAEALWSGLANVNLDEGKLEEARLCAERALKLSPIPADQLNILQQNELARVHATLGVCNYKANDLSASAEQAKLFNQFKLVPNLPPLLRIMEVRPERLKFAPEANQQALKHVSLADMLYEMHQLKDAIKEYRLALKEDPDNLDIHTYLLNALWEDNQWLGAAQEDWSLSNKLVIQLPARAQEIKKLFEQKPGAK